MATVKQFPDVTSRYGSPMGRRESLISADNMPPFKSLALFRVNLDSGGYDDGGAYWGKGEPLYCLFGEGESGDGKPYFVRSFIRTKSRDEAADKMRINPEFLKKNISGLCADKRFTCQREYYGAADPGFVLRFCGEWVDVFSTRQSARDAALKHPRNWIRG